MDRKWCIEKGWVIEGKALFHVDFAPLRDELRRMGARWESALSIWVFPSEILWRAYYEKIYGKQPEGVAKEEEMMLPEPPKQVKPAPPALPPALPSPLKNMVEFMESAAPPVEHPAYLAQKKAEAAKAEVEPPPVQTVTPPDPPPGLPPLPPPPTSAAFPAPPPPPPPAKPGPAAKTASATKPAAATKLASVVQPEPVAKPALAPEVKELKPKTEPVKAASPVASNGQVAPTLLNYPHCYLVSQEITLSASTEITERTPEIEEEYLLGRRLTNRLRAMIRKHGVLVHTGCVLVPTSKSNTLRDALLGVRHEAKRFNAASKYYQLATSMCYSQMASDKLAAEMTSREVAYLIQNELRTLLEATEHGDERDIREAARRVYDVTGDLATEDANLVRQAIAEARAVARAADADDRNADSITAVRNVYNAFMRYAVPEEIEVARRKEGSTT